jgi:hypothetical protein
MATTLLQDYIDLLASIIVSSAARHTHLATSCVGVVIVSEVYGRGDVVPLNVEMIWFRSPWKVGATTLPKGATTPEDTSKIFRHEDHNSPSVIIAWLQIP